MFEFFSNVWGAITTAMDFLWSIIESLLTAIGVVTAAGVLAVDVLAIVPVIIGSSVTIVFAVAVVKFMVGR